MNAYELLKFKDLESDDIQTIDILVKSRTRSGITSLIQELNKELQSESTTLKKLEAVDRILKQLTYYATACDCLDSEENRKAYKKAGMPNVESIADENRSRLFDHHLLIPNDDSKLTNAYQILKMRNGTITIEFDDKSKKGNKDKKDDKDGVNDKNEIKDEYVRSKTLNLVKLNLDISPLNTMEEIEKMIIQLLRYMWAYSKIDTREKRLAYTCKLYARKGKEATKGIVPMEKEGSGLSRITDITNLGKNREDYKFITVCQTNNILYYKGVTPDDSIIAGEYIVTKHKADGREASYLVYSNIDIDRLNSDDKYASQVTALLTDERLALGTRFFGGYLGDIVNGKHEVSLEKVGICNKFAERNRQSQKAPKDKEETAPINKAAQSAPDPDDDFDI